MMGSKQSRRCNLRVALDGAGELRRGLEAVRSRRDWAMDSSLSLGSIRFKAGAPAGPEQAVATMTSRGTGGRRMRTAKRPRPTRRGPAKRGGGGGLLGGLLVPSRDSVG